MKKEENFFECTFVVSWTMLSEFSEEKKIFAKNFGKAKNRKKRKAEGKTVPRFDTKK